MKIRIAELPIEWQTEYADFVKDFECENIQEPIISLKFIHKLCECHGIQYIETPSEHFLRHENGEILFADSSWTNAVTFTHRMNNSEHSLPLAALCSKFSEYNTLFLHASLIDYDGNGILFTGFSGIGKTTQAELWQKHLGAEIINGDKAFIRCFTKEAFAYGCPWKGSSEYCLNRKVKLKGIVVLGQSQENKITRLDSLSAIEKFMPNLFLPHWDNACLQKSLDTFDVLMNNVPVYLLECRPDEDSVRLTYETILKDG